MARAFWRRSGREASFWFKLEAETLNLPACSRVSRHGATVASSPSIRPWEDSGHWLAPTPAARPPFWTSWPCSEISCAGAAMLLAPSRNAARRSSNCFGSGRDLNFRFASRKTGREQRTSSRGTITRPSRNALEALMYHLRRPRSSSLYEELAMKLSLHRSTDSSFGRLRSTLSRWFPC